MIQNGYFSNIGNDVLSNKIYILLLPVVTKQG